MGLHHCATMSATCQSDVSSLGCPRVSLTIRLVPSISSSPWFSSPEGSLKNTVPARRSHHDKVNNANSINSEETTQLRRMATWEKGPTTEPRTCDLRPSAEFQPLLLSCVVSSEFKQLVPAHKEHIQCKQ